MRVTFPGVGEAFDETLPNTCVLLETEEHSALLDCGFTAAHAYWRHALQPMSLSAVWISHFHGDHFLGVPLLLLRFWEQGRTAPLAVIGQTGVGDLVIQAMDMAYPNFRQRMQFPLDFHELDPGATLETAGFTWSAAPGEHSAPSLGLRIEADGKSLYYSGDGRPTPETLALAKDADLVVHEAYALEGDTPGHGTISGAIDFARQANAKRLWLVHVNRDARADNRREIETLLRQAADLEAFLPEPGDAIDL